jgi:hypothetical protein
MGSNCRLILRTQPRRHPRRPEAAGVEFIEQNGGGPGVRLRKVGGDSLAVAACASCRTGTCEGEKHWKGSSLRQSLPVCVSS